MGGEAVQNILLGSQVTNGAPAGGAPLVVLQKSKKKYTNGAPGNSAPLLVTSNGAL